MNAPSQPLGVTRALFVLALSGIACLATAQDPARRWQHVTGATHGEIRGMAAGDFDDDGLPDVAIAFGGPAVIVRIEGVSVTQWTTKQILVAPGDSSRDVPVAWERPGPDQLVLLSNNGDARLYGDWPLRELKRFNFASGATAGAIADIDVDGSDELVVVGSAGVLVYDVESGQEEWRLPGASLDLQLLQLDADDALELVIAGQSGRIIDGATRAQEWLYPDGFGAYLAGGRFALDGSMGFVGMRDWGAATVFRGPPWSPLWDYPGSDRDSIDSCDVDGDGIDEFIVGDGQWGDLHVVDTQTQVDRRTIVHDDHGSSDVSARDFFGTGGCQIAFAPANPYSGKMFRIYDPTSGSELHSVIGFPESLGAVAIGDLDGDGSHEVVTAARNGDLRTLRVTDAASGEIRWQLTIPTSGTLSPYRMEVQRVLLGQVDGDSAQEIVLVGDYGGSSGVVVVDSATREVQLQIGDHVSGPMDDRDAKDAVLLDYDGDSRDDVVVATRAGNTGESGAKLHVFGLDNGATLWESVALGTGFASIVGVLAVQSDLDPALELVAVLPTGLRAFDAQTGLLEWTVTLAGGIVSAGYDSTNREIALARDGQISLHASTADAPLLRTFDTLGEATALIALPGPRWVAYDEAYLAVYNSSDGAPIGLSEWIGPALRGAQLGGVASGDGTRIASATRLGHQVHDIGRTPFVFSDGFEP